MACEECEPILEDAWDEASRLKMQVAELEFRVWYYERSLDAWAGKAMALEHLLKGEEIRVTGYPLIQMEYEEGKFRQVCDEVNSRLKEWYRENRPETYQAILEKHGLTDSPQSRPNRGLT